MTSIQSDIQSDNSGLFDFSTTPLASDYSGFYVKVLDSIFTPTESASLVALAESDQSWDVAKITTRLGDEVDKTFRNNDRIICMDHSAANMIYQRLLPHVQELLEIEPGSRWENIIGSPGNVIGIWKLVGVNERLSFLRYGPGNFFKPHCDGQVTLPDGRRSKVTLQIYLNDEGLLGGATRIIGNRNRYVDIEPKIGRVLVFQQKGLYHSGEEVLAGLKYTLRSDFLFEQSC